MMYSTSVLKKRKSSELKVEIPISQKKKHHIKNVTGLSDLMNKICVECDIIEKKSLYFRKHNCIKCEKKMVFKCLLCPNILHTLTQFYDHIETVHQEYEEYLSIFSIITVLYCTNCQNNFELKSAKQSLECPNCSAKLLFQCTSCGIFHETYLNIMNHSRIHGKKELLEAKRNNCNYLSVYKRYCVKCNKISRYTYHKSKGYCEKCELPLSYQCSYCNDTFKTWETVIHHVEKKFSPDGKEVNCKICGEGFTSFEDFKIHLLLCENSEKYHVCKSCLFRTYHIEEFEKHLKSLICSKCRNCKRIFENKSGLQKHLGFCNKMYL